MVRSGELPMDHCQEDIIEAKFSQSAESVPLPAKVCVHWIVMFQGCTPVAKFLYCLAGKRRPNNGGLYRSKYVRFL